MTRDWHWGGPGTGWTKAPDWPVTHAVELVQCEDGTWHWMTLDADAKVILWNAQPFADAKSAGDDAFRTHDDWRAAGATQPYGEWA